MLNMLNNTMIGQTQESEAYDIDDSPSNSSKATNKASHGGALFNLLKAVSLGQYRTPLYYQGKATYSTVFSGVLTILNLLGLLACAVYIYH